MRACRDEVYPGVMVVTSGTRVGNAECRWEPSGQATLAMACARASAEGSNVVT
jgi:hypothetical protein